MTLPFPATPPEPFFTVTSGSDSPADAPNAVLDVPHWDADTRTLTWQGRVVKRFRVRAVNQEPILAAFQELGWPPRIDDPLPRPKGRDPKVRLRDTVRSLNHRQQFSGLRFEADGTGTGVCWRPA